MLFRLDRSHGEPQLQVVDPTELAYDPARRRVVSFPPSGIFNNRVLGRTDAVEQKLAGTIKAFEQSMEPLGASSVPPVDLYIYMMDDNWGEMLVSAHRHFKQDARPPKDFPQAFDPVLRGMLLKKGETFESLTPAQLQERISRLTFASISGGSLQSLNAADCVRSKLQAMGWSEPDVAKTMQELVLVNIASMTRFDTPGPNATRFAFTASNDPMVDSALAALTGMGPREHKVASGYGGSAIDPSAIEITSLAPGQHVRAHMPKQVAWEEKLPDGGVKPRNLNAVNVPFLGPFREHSVWNFLHGHEKMGHAVRNVMLHAVTREPGIGDGRQFLEKHPLNSWRGPLQVQEPATKQAHDR